MSGRPGLIDWKDPERLEALKELIEDGYTRKQIAEVLSAQWDVPVSQNSIAGKRYRLKKKGLVNVKPHVLECRAMAAEQPQAVKRKRVRIPLIEPEVPMQDGIGVGFMDLSPDNCHWPLWPELTNKRLFCGQPRDQTYGIEYCPKHRFISEKGTEAWNRLPPLRQQTCPQTPQSQ